MAEDITNTVIEALAETIKRLRVDLIVLKCENDRLREKIAMYEKPIDKEGKRNA